MAEDRIVKLYTYARVDPRSVSLVSEVGVVKVTWRLNFIANMC